MVVTFRFEVRTLTDPLCGIFSNNSPLSTKPCHHWVLLLHLFIHHTLVPTVLPNPGDEGAHTWCISYATCIKMLSLPRSMAKFNHCQPRKDSVPTLPSCTLELERAQQLRTLASLVQNPTNFSSQHSHQVITTTYNSSSKRDILFWPPRRRSRKGAGRGAGKGAGRWSRTISRK